MMFHYEELSEKSSCGVGFLCDINGKKSNKILKDSLEVLKKLAHRGAVGADPKTGDGAGILIQIPHEFFLKVADKERINLPSSGDYGTGIVFLPRNREERNFCKEVFEKVSKEKELELIGWRKVPVNNSIIGETAKETEPVIEQVFIKKNKNLKNLLDFERVLYVVRKKIENIIRNSNLKEKSFFYITNISSRTISYKGLLMPEQLEEYYLDLKDKDLKTSLSLIHSRYSTNTFPTWDLAQPFRFLAHNGEINTLRGNINWMKGRESILSSKFFKKDIENLKPVIVSGGSDSAMLDNVFELLVLSGRSLEHSMMMLIPPAWENNTFIKQNVRDFYQYHACFTEPWDGPAAVAFTDGTKVGAILDRNGLRPARYLITKTSEVIMASEVGVLEIEGKNILYSGRLEPGKIFFVDTEEKRIVEDEEIKQRMASRKPYGEWVRKNMVVFEKIPTRDLNSVKIPESEIQQILKALDYTREDIKVIIKPMVENGKEPIGSMGNDTPHAVLSKRPKLLFNYFKQLFAQVTNPAIDPIREEIVMSLDTYVGPQRNFLEETPEHAKKIKIKEPILFDEDLEKIKNLEDRGFKTKTISILFENGSKENFKKALDRICFEADKAVDEGYSIIILSDRGINKDKIALPSLLAASTVHQHLVRNNKRTRIGIILESAEPREVHHFALLFGYGVDCISPYGVFSLIKYLIEDGEINLSYKKAIENYRKAVNKGILKIMSKMGISTLQSYRGAQIFEAIGLSKEVVERSFTGTVSRIGGADFDVIAEETISRHREAFKEEREFSIPHLWVGGIYQWKKDGEKHLWSPDTIALLQDSTRKNDYGKYKEFAYLVNNQKDQPVTLRSLFNLKKNPIPIEEVEPVEKILKRFATGAMSFGSISRGAHETIAIAMNRIGGMSNTGEGGEDPERFKPLPDGDSKNSFVKQCASGRFGVTTNYLTNAKEIQIKIAQGAKPGEGGQLPGHKVSAIIAKTRYTTEGVTLISPPPHHDIYSIEDLAQLIFDLKNVNPDARISVKLVSEIGIGVIAAGVAKGHADMILISGGDGGTGASPISSIQHAGLPWEFGLSEVHQTLVLQKLRSRVRLQVDGKMLTGRDVAIAALLGAEEFGFCTSALIVLGCVMLRHCHLNNCSVGVATQNEILQKRFGGKPEYLVNYFHFVANELREIMSELGFRKLDEMIGRTDLIEINKDILPWKTKKLDFSKILFMPPVKQEERYKTKEQDHKIENVLDRKLIKLCKKSLESKEKTELELEIKNTNRTTGAMLSGEVCKRFGEDGLPDDTIHVKFKGYAGQSFGAWLMKGITFELEGMANDYVGKGISGGKIIIYPFKDSDYTPEENIIIGNTTFYGAIKGEAYIRGKAGERFCIRNSGLYAVVEGVGDHGCEYMTGGRVVVLGETGRNFAAGMSGGIAYVYDPKKEFPPKCNMMMVELEKLNEEDEETVFALIHNHYHLTSSSVARKILDNFKNELKNFVKVMPIEYKRILEGKKIEERLDLLEVSDG